MGRSGGEADRRGVRSPSRVGARPISDVSRRCRSSSPVASGVAISRRIHVSLERQPPAAPNSQASVPSTITHAATDVTRSCNVSALKAGGRRLRRTCTPIVGKLRHPSQGYRDYGPILHGDYRRYRTTRRVTSSTSVPPASAESMSERCKTAVCASASIAVTQRNAASPRSTVRSSSL